MTAFDALQKIQRDLIRKTTNGSVFAAPVTAATIDETTLFDTVTGDLAVAGLPAGYTDLGYLSTAGAVLGRSVSESNVTSWQSVTPTRTDMTSSTATIQVVAQETKLINIGIYTGADLAALKTAARTNGVVRIDEPSTPADRSYRILSIGVDENDFGEIVIARYLPKAKPTGFDNQAMAPGDNAFTWGLTFTGFRDDVLGTASSYLFGGAGWRALLTKMGFTKTLTVSTTSGQANITATTGTFSAADVGAKVTGAGIPAGATILTYTDATHVVLSATATATGASVSAVVGG